MRLLVYLLPLALAACVTPEMRVAETQRQQAAEAEVTAALVIGYPGRELPATSNCIIDNATDAEIQTLVASRTGADVDAVATVTGIAVREPTLDCFAGNGVAPLI